MRIIFILFVISIFQIILLPYSYAEDDNKILFNKIEIPLTKFITNDENTCSFDDYKKEIQQNKINLEEKTKLKNQLTSKISKLQAEVIEKHFPLNLPLLPSLYIEDNNILEKYQLYIKEDEKYLDSSTLPLLPFSISPIFDKDIKHIEGVSVSVYF